MIGSYKGFYRYNSSRVRKLIGYELTYFNIVIDFCNGKEFTGTVLDDEKTGGMKEQGLINGKLEGSKITFEKYMPRHYTVDFKNNHQEELNDIHPTIMYYGSATKNFGYKGTWKIPTSYKVLWGTITLKSNIGSGTWEMQKQNQ
jgi:hypothetical protein